MHKRPRLIHEQTTSSILGAFYEVYTNLGFGFREYLYSLALERELRARGHKVTREKWVMVYYKGELLGRQRLDMLVDDKVIVENKSEYRLRDGTCSQLYNYLHGTDLEVGLELHYGPKPKFYRVAALNSWRVATRSVQSDPSVQSVSDDVDPSRNDVFPGAELGRSKQRVDHDHVPESGLERDRNRSDSPDSL